MSQEKRSIGIAHDDERLLLTFPGWAASVAVPWADYCATGKVAMITLMTKTVSIHGCNGRLRTDAARGVVEEMWFVADTSEAAARLCRVPFLVRNNTMGSPHAQVQIPARVRQS
jgi:hypothetical protein